MKKRRQAGVILIAAALICGLAACGSSEKESSTGTGGVTMQPEQQNNGWNANPDSGEDTGPAYGQDAELDEKQDAEPDNGEDADAEDGQDADAEDGEDTDTEDGEDADTEDKEDTEPDDGQNAGALTVDDYAFSSNDWRTLEFALDGKVYTFPLTWSDIEAAGFVIDEEYRHEVLETNYYTLSVNAENEAGERISVRFKNFEEGDRELQDCYVYGIGFEQSQFRDVNPEVMLCNGVTFGMTPDEVKALMGEPDYDYVSEGDENTGESMEYYVTGHSYENEIEFYFWNGLLTEIDLLDKE